MLDMRSPAFEIDSFVLCSVHPIARAPPAAGAGTQNVGACVLDNAKSSDRVAVLPSSDCPKCRKPWGFLSF